MSPTATRWVSFEDDENTTWLFDTTFLTSNWRCTFGTTCQGTEPDDNGARGCCAHGAHLVDQEEQQLIAELASRLTPEQWQNHGSVVTEHDLFDQPDGETATRVVDDACIFLNDRGFAGGHGCALHLGALAADERPLDWKPAVCWQVPFRLEEFEDGAGTRTVVVRAWRRSDWGEGGADFGWFCTDTLEPGNEHTATWVHHLDELVELVGDWPVAMLTAYLSPETPVSLQRSGLESDAGSMAPTVKQR